jgi:hypothetical protein
MDVSLDILTGSRVRLSSGPFPVKAVHFWFQCPTSDSSDIISQLTQTEESETRYSTIHGKSQAQLLTWDFLSFPELSFSYLIKHHKPIYLLLNYLYHDICTPHVFTDIYSFFFIVYFFLFKVCSLVCHK